jgi:hypothetical protein
VNSKSCLVLEIALFCAAPHPAFAIVTGVLKTSALPVGLLFTEPPSITPLQYHTGRGDLGIFQTLEF